MGICEVVDKQPRIKNQRKRKDCQATNQVAKGGKTDKNVEYGGSVATQNSGKKRKNKAATNELAEKNSQSIARAQDYNSLQKRKRKRKGTPVDMADAIEEDNYPATYKRSPNELSGDKTNGALIEDPTDTIA